MKKDMEEKQRQRSENIKQHIQQKREQKLSTKPKERPGFEGESVRKPTDKGKHDKKPYNSHDKNQKDHKPSGFKNNEHSKKRNSAV